MKVGDMVVRAYAFRAFIPGIIVDEHIESYTTDSGDPEFEPYQEHNYIVQWSDGSQTNEMYEELEMLEEALELEVNSENR